MRGKNTTCDRRQFLKSSAALAAGAGMLTHCDRSANPTLSRAKDASTYLIVNGLVVTMDPERRVITEGAVAIKDNLIEAVGKTADLRKEYGAYDIIDAGKGIIMPGLVNAHSHLFAMGSRGLGVDGVGRRSTRSNYRWDIDKNAHYDKELCRASADLAAVEMIRAGITTTQDSHYINFHLDAIDGVAESIEKSGMRAVI